MMLFGTAHFRVFPFFRFSAYWKNSMQNYPATNYNKLGSAIIHYATGFEATGETSIISNI